MSVERNLGLIILVLSIISVMGQSNVSNKTTSVLVKPSRSISPLLQDPTLSLSSVQPLRTPSVSLSSVFTKQELQTSISNAATPSPSPSFSSTKTFLSRSSMSITPTRSIEISRILLTTVQSSTTLNSTVALSVSTVSSVKSISEMTVSLLQSKSYSSSSKIVSTTSTKYSFKLTVSDLIQETNTPTTTIAAQNDLLYIGVGLGFAVIIAAVVITSIVLYFCYKSKKYEYSTGNADFRASVTVQRYHPNKEHYTVNPDSVFSSRGSSVRSSFGSSNANKTRKKSFTSADHVTAIINLEMFSTPM